MTNQIPENQPLQEQPMVSEVVDFQSKTNANILGIFHGKYGFVNNVVKILKGEKSNPADLVNALQTTRSQIREMGLLEESKLLQAANDEKYLLDGTN